MAHFRWQGEDLLLYCHLQPKASRNECCGLHGERLKLRVSAPPVDGRANSELIAFIAGQFGVAKQSVEILQGESGRQKTIVVHHPQYLPEGWGITRP